MNNKATVVIPARIGSSRFPRKPLAKIAGMMMIERVWRIGQAVSNAERVLIATDSPEIESAAKAFGAEVVMTDEDCRTGTDRVQQAVSKISDDSEIVLSFQGDAVLTPPKILEDLIASIASCPSCQIATPANKLVGQELDDFVGRKKKGSSSGTLVVFDKDRKALYFSKGLIPNPRDSNYREVYQHIGIYAYRKEALSKFVSLPDGRLEQIEKLEQLRALENGMEIQIVEVNLKDRTIASVDNPEDVQIVEAIISKEGELL